MWRFARAFVTIIFASATAFSTAQPAEANRACPYWVSVSRENFPGEQTARLCDLNRLAEWLKAVPDASLLTQTPQGTLNDGFTVTVVTVPGWKHIEALPPGPGIGRVLLTERVYPVAESGPVAFVPSRSVMLRHPGPFPTWVVDAGWRALDATKRVPPVLAELGMLQPMASPTTPTLAPTTAAPTTGSSRPGPDLVTLLFLLAVLVSVGAAIRRSMRRISPNVPEGAGDRPGVSPHG
jgi:hypothetical protein